MFKIIAPKLNIIRREAIKRVIFPLNFFFSSNIVLILFTVIDFSFNEKESALLILYFSSKAVFAITILYILTSSLVEIFTTSSSQELSQ